MSPWKSTGWGPALLLAGLVLSPVGAAPTPAPAPTAAEPGSPDELYELGKSLFEQYAPPEIQAQYDFPTPR